MDCFYLHNYHLMISMIFLSPKVYLNYLTTLLTPYLNHLQNQLIVDSDFTKQNLIYSYTHLIFLRMFD